MVKVLHVCKERYLLNIYMYMHLYICWYYGSRLWQKYQILMNCILKRNPNQNRKTNFSDKEQSGRQCDRVYCVGPVVKYLTNSNGAHTVRKFLIGWVLNLNSTIFQMFLDCDMKLFFSPFCVIGNSEKYLIRVAMREWEKYTCLRFRKRQRENNYVMFQDNFGWAQKWYTRNILNAKRNENHL